MCEIVLSFLIQKMTIFQERLELWIECDYAFNGDPSLDPPLPDGVGFVIEDHVLSLSLSTHTPYQLWT